MTRRRGILFVTGALILIVPPVAWVVGSIPADRALLPNPGPGPAPEPVKRAIQPAEMAAMVELAQRDPMALVERGEERYDREITEYRCVLTKQERLGKKLGDVQQIEVRFRERPRAIFMHWLQNADQARRALYMETDDFLDSKGRRLVRVEPHGAVARLFTKDIKVRVDSPEAKKSSRRSIAECGFGSTFDLLEAYNESAAKRGVLDLRFAGMGEVDGRPTYVIVRDLPYQGEGGPFPDARMVLHLDQEWLLPVAVYSYADHQEKELLGSYVFSKVDLDPDFTDADFQF